MLGGDRQLFPSTIDGYVILNNMLSDIEQRA